ncbi:hypothetical protein KXW38_000527, partial [Aspergillus fumigatus]
IPEPRCSANWPKILRSMTSPGLAASTATSTGAPAAMAGPPAIRAAPAPPTKAERKAARIMVFSTSILPKRTSDFSGPARDMLGSAKYHVIKDSPGSQTADVHQPMPSAACASPNLAPRASHVALRRTSRQVSGKDKDDMKEPRLRRRQSGRPTVNDVARLAQCSPMTVSR